VPDLPSFKAWETPENATVKDIIAQYQKGFAGALYSQEAHEKFLDGVAIKTGEDVCSAMGYEESAKGELVLPVRHIQEAYPNALPGPGQVEGDCVSHGQKNANLGTLVCEAISGVPDPVSGHVEALPVVSPLGEKNGVLSTEAIYAFRSTKPGHGWFCAESASVSQTKAGCVLRQEYPGIDLTKYGKDTVNYWNRKSASRELVEQWDDHIVREATEVRSAESLRDLLARGFCVNTCGSEGWSSTRDENGVSKRQGSWAHSMAVLGLDDREWAHRSYGGPLVLIQNSWAAFNSGPRKIYGTDLEIPKGSFWARWKDCSRRSMIAMAGANGWRRTKLPDYSPGW